MSISVADSIEIASVALYDCAVTRGSGNVLEPGNVETTFAVKSNLDDDGDLLCLIEAKHVFTDQAASLLAEIVVRYLSTYAVDEGVLLTEQEIKEYSAETAVPHVVPFVREFLANMTNRLALPPFYLPIIRHPAEHVVFEDGASAQPAVSVTRGR
jgi:hypothetical protein